MLGDMPEDNDVKELLSCYLFKQFTTVVELLSAGEGMSKNYYHVTFLSNSQLGILTLQLITGCQRTTIMLPF